MSSPVLSDDRVRSLRDIGYAGASEAFSINRAIARTGVMGTLLGITAMVSAMVIPTASMPVAAGVSALAAFVIGLFVIFNPLKAKSLGFVYMLLEGVVIGSISVLTAAQYGAGVVFGAVLATFAALFVMLTLYRTGIVKVTERFTAVVVGGMIGLLGLYLVGFIASLFGINLGIFSGGLLAILVSIVAVGLACASLAIDFKQFEDMAKMRVSADLEWYAAFGVMVTMVWLYLELLRLLSHFTGRD